MENFLSFKEMQELSLIATDKKNVKHTFSTPDNKLQLLHGAAIFGANAAGKTNLIVAMHRMKRLVLNSVEHKESKNLSITPFLLNSRTKEGPTRFEIEFLHNNFRYRYGFLLNEKMIIDEWLYYRKPDTYKENKMFDRTYSSWGDFLVSVNNQGRAFYQSIASRTNPQQLFLSKAAGGDNAEMLKPIYEWFRDVLLFDSDINVETTFRAVLSGKQQEVLNFLQSADLSIRDLDVQEQEFDRSEAKQKMQEQNVPESLQNSILEQLDGETGYKVRTIHLDENNRTVFLPLSLESAGTNKMIEYAGTILDVLLNGKVLVVDELEDSLHPLLLDHLVLLFNENKASAQVIFTTHAVNLMTPEKLRKDQIWFVDKNQKQESELYSFMEFSPRGDGRESWGKRYLHGFYGGIPYIHPLESQVKNGD